MSDEPSELTKEWALAAMQRIGRSVGCDHCYCPDGVITTEHCIETELAKAAEHFECNLWGSPWLGVGRLRLHFGSTGYYTIWMLFLTRWLAFGIHVGGKGKR